MYTTSIRDFKKEKILGKGSFGSVYLVRRRQDNKIYALKTVILEKLNKKEQENSVNEVRILASINHPNVIGYKEAFWDDEKSALNIVMEYADDGDLHSKIEKMKKAGGYFKENIIWSYAIQMIEGLKALHDKKIMHRDLKSANIFLVKDKHQCKLGDMNVSKVIKEKVLHTQTGTPYYASPEVWNDAPYSYKSDLWSIGCVIYELCNLKPPFQGKDLDELYENVCKGNPERINKAYSDELWKMILMLLQVDVNKRADCNMFLNSDLIRKKMMEMKKDPNCEIEAFIYNKNKDMENDYLLETIKFKDIKEIKEQKKEEETKNQEEKKENKEDNPIGDEFEVPIKKEIDKEIGIKNMVGDDVVFSEAKTWETLGVKEEIRKGLLEMSFLQPSKIQATTFPIIMKEPRLNVIAQAKNGSGKTGAFGLGAISSVDESNSKIQVVVFAHTRELVVQVRDVLSKIAKNTKVKVTSPLSQETEKDNTEYGQIIVITPGHFDNIFLKKHKDDLLSDLKMLVLDEADYMLTNEVTSKVCEKAFKVFKKKDMKVQILFFSATFDVNCFKFIKKFYDNAYIIELKKEELTLENVKQLYKECNSVDDKVKFIEEYLPLNTESQRVIIFANKRDNVVKLQQNLLQHGYKVFILMGGDMAASNRDETIKKFRNGEIQILITTDVLSRGYDERMVKLVINFDMPIKKLKDGSFDVDYDTYLHRIGRTGRFNTKGVGVNLIFGKRDMENMLKIESFYKTKIEKMVSMEELTKDLKKCILDD